MKKLISVIFLLLIAAFAFAADSILEQNKKNALGFYSTIVAGDAKSAIEHYAGAYYRQHNPQAPDGKAGFLAYFDKRMARIPKNRPRPETVFPRVFAEGDFVLIHRHVILPGNAPDIVSMDLFRMEESKVVEHWDAIQRGVQKNQAKRLVSGPTMAKDFGKSQFNKSLVRKFVENVLVHGNMAGFNSYFDGDNYIQHNPNIPNGVSGLVKSIQEMAKNGITMRYYKVHKIIAEGNFVFVQSEGEFGGKHTAFYDLFRVENEKIAEHWDVIQAVPEKMPHNNGMF